MAYKITDDCISCEACEKEQLLEKWHKLHPGKTPAYTP